MGNCNACVRPVESPESKPNRSDQNQKGKKKSRERKHNPFADRVASPAPIRVLQDVIPLSHRTRIFDKYILGRELGRGEFGITYLCTDRETREALACKSISKKKLRTAVDIEDVRREAAIMSTLPEHPNIVKLKATYEDNENVHLVMELCEGGELFDRIVARGHYTERAAANVTKTIAEVVRMCHENGVMHRDLKPENFLFANKKEHSPLKVIDFGLSVFFKPGEKFSEIVGSPYYMAPEVLRRNYGPEVDVWSAGVILYILLCGVPPFWAETEQGVALAILRGVIDFTKTHSAVSTMSETIDGDSHDFNSLLSSSDRDFLVRNNADQVKIDSLKGKKLGLYFSASWCGPCRRFTPDLIEVYSELSKKGDFEVIFVSADEDEESFNGYFSKMPWLAIPFSDLETRKTLDEKFKVMGIPHLVLLDEHGKVLTDEGVEIIREYGVEGYPFTSEKIQELKDFEEKARKEQSIKTILVSRSRDYVVTSDGNKVPVSELEGKTVGLCFSASSFKPSADFTPKLAEVYKKLKEKGENFEVVIISLEDEEESFKESFAAQWLALPFKDKSCEKLARYFELSTLPTVVIIGPDGKTLHPNAADAIEEHGVEVYPFTPEKFAELKEIEKAKEAAQTLESVLISGDLDYVIGKDGAKVKVTDLVGKTVLLYFSAHWCPPCRGFTPKLAEVYKKIKEKYEAFEVVFISSDRDQTSFEEYYSEMPWLALPFGDARKSSLSRKFKVQGIPKLVAIGPTGQTVSTEARNLVIAHGADAYPFTEERLKEIEAQYEEMAKEWPQKLKHELHEEHELELTRRGSFVCDKCGEQGGVWSFYCGECDFDLHPKCALEKDKETKADAEEEGKTKEGWVCDGEVCTRA